MLALEDLYVATQVKRFELLDTEEVRALLLELADRPDRVPLVRALHERLGLAMEQARGLHDMAQRYLRQRGEERFRALLIQAGFPAAQLEALAQEQAAAHFSWLLGERLVREGRLPADRQQALIRQVGADLAREDQELLGKNRSRRYEPILGPPPGSGRLDARASGRLPTYSEADLEGEDGLRTMVLGPGAVADAVASGPPPVDPEEEDDDLSFDIHLPQPTPPAMPAARLAGSGSGSGFGPRPGSGVGGPGSGVGGPGSGVGGPGSGVGGPGAGQTTSGIGGPGAGQPASGIGGVQAGPAGSGVRPGSGSDVGRSVGVRMPGSGRLAPLRHESSGRLAKPSFPPPDPPQIGLRLPPGAASAPPPEEPDPNDVTWKMSPGESPFGTVQMNLGGGAPAAQPRPPGPAAGGPGGPGGGHVGQTLGGRYRIERELGRGAMGIVYQAQDGQRGPVALKLVQGPVTAEVKGRFEREIAVSQRIAHTHVISVFDHGELPDQSSFMVMELLDGESLQGIIVREGAQPTDRSLALLEQLLQGLAAVHGSGIVHRDLKPENLQVLQRSGKDHVKIVDFGISRFLEGEGAEDAGQFFQTMRGNLSGTPQYVAPEAVLDPDVITPGHDIYACGVILYELLTGQLPFPASRSLKDMLADTVNARARPLDEAHPAGAPYPKPLERLVRRLLEKDPEARPGDATAALELLAEVRAELGGKGAKGGGDGEAKGFTARLLRSITSLFKGRSEES
ncbi:MAG: serine/threonine-protein kinase [Planctomycetota bacterium]